MYWRVKIAVFGEPEEIMQFSNFAKTVASPMEDGREGVKERKLTRLARVETTVCALTIL